MSMSLDCAEIARKRICLLQPAWANGCGRRVSKVRLIRNTLDLLSIVAVQGAIGADFETVVL